MKAEQFMSATAVVIFWVMISMPVWMALYRADVACERKDSDFTLDMEVTPLAGVGDVVCENGEIAHWETEYRTAWSELGNERLFKEKVVVFS